MIQGINYYQVITIKVFYISNIINHQNLKYMDHRNMASAIGLDGVELVQFIIQIDLQLHRCQE